MTPLNVDRFEELLADSSYDSVKAQFLINGFRQGFNLGYEGPTSHKSQSENIPLTIGTAEDLWEKIMKEVKFGRVVGPFDSIPYDNYIQSPVGLVPKAGGKTRMIFHLSYNFSDKWEDASLNAWTPREKCTVKYNDLDIAVRECLKLVEQLNEQATQEGMNEADKPVIYLGKTDLSSAFRVLPLMIHCFHWLIFKAKDPCDGKFKYFVDKCLPFRASISCALYQTFSDALRFVLEFKAGPMKGKAINNYLDDFLFMAITCLVCNQLIDEFLTLCNELNIPVAVEKTEWATEIIVFLGILLNGRALTLSIPLDKQEKTLKLLNNFTGKKRATVRDLQVLTGYLNFLTKAIIPGRTFNRRMYSKYSKIEEVKLKNGKSLKPYHHVSLDSEF